MQKKSSSQSVSKSNMGSDDNLANLRVASFSYYLKSNDQETFVQKLMSPQNNPSIIQDSIKSKESPHKVKQLSAHLNDPQESFMFNLKGTNMDAKSPLNHIERNKSMDGEIDIFGADKYFNMKLECPVREKIEKKKEDRTVDVVDAEIKANLRQVTPSVCSEASTWSSGVAFLQNFPRITSQKKPKRTRGRRFLSSIGCTGPCFDKESVYVNRNSKPDRKELNTCQVYQSAGSNIGHNFTFPLVGVVKPSLKLNLTQLENKKIEELRKSIEVFGSDTMKKDEITKNLERRLSMLTWDAIPKSSSLPTSVVSTTVCDDMASDVSSDLFEIENISASCGGYNMRARESVDGVSNCMASPTTQYAPSEASFEWSVMTASAIDFSSGVSDYDPNNFGASCDAVVSNLKNSIASKEAPKSRPGRLLGCKSLRSVNVAETVHKNKVERY